MGNGEPASRNPSALRIFSYYTNRVRIHPSARKHGVAEVVVLVTVEGTQLAIHAMRMRPMYERLLRT